MKLCSLNYKNYFTILIFLYIASTLIFSIGSNINITRGINVLLLGSFVFYFLQKKDLKISIHKFLWTYLFFAIYALSSMFWSYDSSNSIFDSLKLLIIVINLIILYNIINYFKIQKAILYGLIFSAFYNYLILFNIIEFSSQYTIHFVNRFVGTTNNPNVLAIYMLFSILASLFLIERNKNKIFISFLYLNIILALYSIILTASKKGALFAIVLILFYLFLSFSSKKGFFISLLSIISIYILFINGVFNNIEGVEHLIYRFELAISGFNNPSSTDSSTLQRIGLIDQAYNVFTKDFISMLFGTGQDAYKFQNSFGLYSHNNYMEILANLGIVGLILYYSIYVFIFQEIKCINDFKTKYLFYFFLIILLIMDNALVSFDFKIYFFLFLFISIEFNKHTIKGEQTYVKN